LLKKIRDDNAQPDFDHDEVDGQRAIEL